MAAAIVIDADCDEVEQRLRTAIGRRRHRIHWRNESDTVRLEFLDALAGQPVHGIAVAVEPTAPRRQERARARAWWSLTWQLAQRNVTHLVIEARQEDLNRRDQRTLSAIQRAGIGAAITYQFAYPSERPLLWAADALAGALSAQHGDGTTRYTDRLPQPSPRSTTSPGDAHRPGLPSFRRGFPGLTSRGGTSPAPHMLPVPHRCA